MTTTAVTSGLPGDARPDAEAGQILSNKCSFVKPAEHSLVPFMTASLVMGLLLVAAVALAAGAWIARWWLLTLPLAMVAGAGLLLAMGSKINQDNPLLFLVLLLELSLAAGIVMRRRLAL